MFDILCDSWILIYLLNYGVFENPYRYQNVTTLIFKWTDLLSSHWDDEWNRGPVACIWCSLNPWIKILLWRCRRFLYLTCSVLRVQVYAPRGCKPRGTARLCRKTSTNWHIILCRGSEGKWIWQMYPWEICLWSAHQEAEGERKEKEEEKGAEAEVCLIEMQTTKKKPQ